MKRVTVALALAAFVAAGVCGCARSHAGARVGASSTRQLRLASEGSFDAPTYVTSPPRDASRLFVVEKRGVVRILVSGRELRRPFVDLSRRVNSSGEEQGLLSLVFAPDYARSGRLYVDFTDARNDVRVVELRRAAQNPNAADPASARNVLTVEHRRFTNHNGGQLAFGPDGDLYVGVGDGGSENDPFGRGQDTNVLLGKLLRIDPRPGGGYSIPPGNPFRGRPGRRAAIWAYGLRNPWRFSFDGARGDLIIGDVGQDRQEELDFAADGSGAGANYGWSIFEGRRRNKRGRARGAVFPVLVTHHSDGYCAIVGGYVVRDRSLASLYGRYLYGDLCKPEIRSAMLSAGQSSAARATGLTVAQLSSFGEDAAGHVYVASLKGRVYRIVSR